MQLHNYTHCRFSKGALGTVQSSHELLLPGQDSRQRAANNKPYMLEAPCSIEKLEHVYKKILHVKLWAEL